MRARDEAEELEDMRAHFLAGKLSGQFPEWQATKRLMLETAGMRWAAQDPAGPMEVLDLGCGDLSHVVGWEPFDQRELLYFGVDGVGEIVQSAAKRFPWYDFRRSPMSQVPDRHLYGFDLVLCLDVLYHLPSDEDHDRLVSWLFGDARARQVLLSWSDDRRAISEPTGSGQDGFSWFPRPRPRIPDGWRSVEGHASTHAGPQQYAELLVRG